MYKRVYKTLIFAGLIFLTACRTSVNSDVQTSSVSTQTSPSHAKAAQLDGIPKTPELTEALHAYNDLLDNIDAYDFGMGDLAADSMDYSIVYIGGELPQLLVRKYYNTKYVAMNKLFGYDVEKHACIETDMLVSTENPPQSLPDDYPNSIGILSLLEDSKGLIYTVMNRSTEDKEIKQLFVWENDRLMMKDLSVEEYAAIFRETEAEKFIRYNKDNRTIFE